MTNARWTTGWLAWLGLAVACQAQPVPRDFTASPDIYRVRGETDRFRVVEAVWKPGQRDQFHGHPVMGYYWITDCSARIYLPEGGYRDLVVSAGTAGTQSPVFSHAVENIGNAECRIVMFEEK